jgi:hypothetical protein
MKRREILRLLAAAPFAMAAGNYLAFAAKETNEEFYKSIIDLVKSKNWQNLKMDHLMAVVGSQFLDKPYKGGTLEGTPEKCRVDLNHLDCVTFYEYTLAIARNIKKGKYGFDQLLDEIKFLRYRDGELTDYASRLHYTSDWFHNNVKKGTIKDITEELGGAVYKKEINFMSEHPDSYQALKNNKAMVDKIEKIEDKINDRTMYYIPQGRIAEIESSLKNGDIVGITSSIKGLDYNHTGIIYNNRYNQKKLMHASSDAEKVIISEMNISEYVTSIEKHTGITVVRPV